MLFLLWGRLTEVQTALRAAMEESNMHTVIHDHPYQSTQEQRISPRSLPHWLTALVLLLMFCAGMGEWKVLNNTLGGLPKVFTAGVIAIAAMHALVWPEVQRLRSVLKPGMLWLGLVVLLLIWSLTIWIIHLTELSVLLRGCAKLLYQTIAMLTAVAMVYLFQGQAAEKFALTLCAVNGSIMLLEIRNYGLVESMQSLVHCLLTFGDAQDYARALEIHDLTFVFGQLALYAAVFAPHRTTQERKSRRRLLVSSSLFFLVGMKRIAIPALLVFGLWGTLGRRMRHPDRLVLATGIGWTGFFFVYLYLVRSGLITRWMQMLNVDMMGRDYIWKLAEPYYELSVTYLGHGFEYVDAIVAQLNQTGVLQIGLAFHNDVLKVFVELGFPGMCLWAGWQYIVCPLFWMKHADNETALLYMALLSYMTVSYLTDNTAFYFWSTMALRLLPMAFAIKKQHINEERPPSSAAINGKPSTAPVRATATVHFGRAAKASANEHHRLPAWWRIFSPAAKVGHPHSEAHNTDMLPASSSER